MADIQAKVFLENLAVHNSGGMQGRWISLPMDEEELQEIHDAITNNGEDEAFISDFEPYEMHLTTYDVFEINDALETIERLDVSETVALAIMDYLGGLLKALDTLEQENYTVHEDMHDMEDVACEFLEATGFFEKIENSDIRREVEMYFDFESYGSTMETNGTFFDSGDGIIEVFN